MGTGAIFTVSFTDEGVDGVGRVTKIEVEDGQVALVAGDHHLAAVDEAAGEHLQIMLRPEVGWSGLVGK